MELLKCTARTYVALYKSTKQPHYLTEAKRIIELIKTREEIEKTELVTMTTLDYNELRKEFVRIRREA